MDSFFDRLETEPRVSCIMPTYGRPEYVREAVECFVRQDYQNKELLLLNDCVGQVSEGEVPGVRAVNHPLRYATLGEKRNAAIELASGDVIAIWDDDDLSLPWRLSLSVREMHRHQTSFYRRAEFLAYWGEAELHDNQSVPSWMSHGTVCFTRGLWEAAGRYPTVDLGEDRLFFKAIHELLGEEFIAYPLARTDRFYILRGKSAYIHMSMSGGEKPLDCSPGRYPIVPRPIKDPVLRAAWDRVREQVQP